VAGLHLKGRGLYSRDGGRWARRTTWPQLTDLVREDGFRRLTDLDSGISLRVGINEFFLLERGTQKNFLHRFGVLIGVSTWGGVWGGGGGLLGGGVWWLGFL